MKLRLVIQLLSFAIVFNIVYAATIANKGATVSTPVAVENDDEVGIEEEQRQTKFLHNSPKSRRDDSSSPGGKKLNMQSTNVRSEKRRDNQGDSPIPDSAASAASDSGAVSSGSTSSDRKGGEGISHYYLSLGSLDEAGEEHTLRTKLKSMLRRILSPGGRGLHSDIPTYAIHHSHNFYEPHYGHPHGFYRRHWGHRGRFGYRRYGGHIGMGYHSHGTEPWAIGAHPHTHGPVFFSRGGHYVQRFIHHHPYLMRVPVHTDIHHPLIRQHVIHDMHYHQPIIYRKPIIYRHHHVVPHDTYVRRSHHVSLPSQQYAMGGYHHGIDDYHHDIHYEPHHYGGIYGSMHRQHGFHAGDLGHHGWGFGNTYPYGFNMYGAGHQWWPSHNAYGYGSGYGSGYGFGGNSYPFLHWMHNMNGNYRPYQNTYSNPWSAMQSLHDDHVRSVLPDSPSNHPITSRSDSSAPSPSSGLSSDIDSLRNPQGPSLDASLDPTKRGVSAQFIDPIPNPAAQSNSLDEHNMDHRMFNQPLLPGMNAVQTRYFNPTDQQAPSSVLQQQSQLPVVNDGHVIFNNKEYSTNPLVVQGWQDMAAQSQNLLPDSNDKSKV
ncbi:unnamed protein product [Didymodactylos carnosus]|uniref:Uncharacterized protein n=1 Tax=Didymodactylos carnosus TaxID=1234261 RepID=A0A813TFJ6_9BILA|nr:unnamed protein product [Didymodactylos carnosus]CAF0834554.1 unnamed protein product [Didymodactylos carnosus]CAF3596576.1 unnamed protein product [Didymodactylos carnosus]CAF3619283.1 unnamed protein product [Didymodactylos carnosus]